jgi:hypothetical protein
MHADHTSQLYRIQLFVVWLNKQAAVIETISFSETVFKQVFCIGPVHWCERSMNTHRRLVSREFPGGDIVEGFVQDPQHILLQRPS